MASLAWIPVPAMATPISNLLQGLTAFSRTPLIHCHVRSRIPVCNSIHKISPSVAEGFKTLKSGNLGLRSLSPRVSTDGGGFGGSGDGNSGGGGGGGNGNSSDDGADGSAWPFLSWYLSLLAKYPVITKGVTSAFLNLIGDLVCQVMIDQVQSIDVKRTSIFTLLGLVLVGPTLHFWYLYLSQLMTNPGAFGAFSRLLLDQFIFAPIFVGTFLSAVLMLEGRPSDVIPKLKQDWFSSVIANWQLWIPFQFLNFRFVPQHFQVLAANFIALIWNVYLSYKAHKEVLAK